MPLLEKRQVLAAAVEETCGTAESLDATDAAFMVSDPHLRPEFDTAPRERSDSLDGRATVPYPHKGRCTFALEMAGDGSGGVPPWAPVFLPACTLARTGAATKIFSRLMAPPKTGATDVRTITIGLFRDGVYEQLHGAMGSVDFRFVLGRIVKAYFDFVGGYTSNADAAVPEPTFPTVAPLKFGDATTYTSPPPPTATMIQVNINVKNTLALIEDRTQTSGIKHAVATEGIIEGRITTPSATTYTKALRDYVLARTEFPLAVVSGVAGNNKMSWQSARTQLLSVEPEDDGILYDGLPYRINSASGNGQGALTITFS